MTSTAINQTCVVAKIVDEKRETLLSLAVKGIKPNVPIHIVKMRQKDLVLCVAGKMQTISRKEAESIWVKTIEVKGKDVQE